MFPVAIVHVAGPLGGYRDPRDCEGHLPVPYQECSRCGVVLLNLVGMTIDKATEVPVPRPGSAVVVPNPHAAGRPDAVVGGKVLAVDCLPAS